MNVCLVSCVDASSETSQVLICTHIKTEIDFLICFNQDLMKNLTWKSYLTLVLHPY